MLAWQGCEQWFRPLEKALQPLEEKYELVFVYLTKRILGMDG